MIPKPLAELWLRLRPSSHLSALWWLGLLYRRPKLFREALAELPKGKQVLLGICLYLHFVPYLVLVVALGRALIFGVFRVELNSVAGFEGWQAHGATLVLATLVGLGSGIAVWIAFGIAGGIAPGVAIGVAFGIALGIALGVVRGIAQGVALGVAGGITLGFFGGIAFGIALGIARGIPPAIPFRIAIGIVLGSAGAIAFGIAGGISIGIAAGVALTRAYYLPAHWLFVFPSPRGRTFPFHPVAWDDLCSAPFLGLHRLLVAYAVSEPEKGPAEIDLLIESYPSQKAEALKARTILVLREAGHQRDFPKVGEVLAGLPEGEKGYLAQTQDARRLAHSVITEAARLETADRPFLREPAARAVVSELQTLRARAAGFHEPLSSELQAAADLWLAVARGRLEEVRRALDKAPLIQPFRAGDPVDAQREAFVQRSGVIGDLEQQVRLSAGSPGILLCGRRRVGKSTVLRNLPFFLPPSIGITRLSLQDAKVFTSQEDFCATVGGTISAATSKLETSTATNLARLMDRLEKANEVLESEDRRLVVALDEYEGIDVKIGEGVFSEDLLATLRESIQRHHCILWMFAGVHEMTELPNAPWSSYLVSTRLLEVPLFTEAETRLLLTEPLKLSTLWRDREEERPRFEPGFWGEGGIERIQTETGGWPHLVQLVAEVMVDLLNRQSLPHVTPEVFEEALDSAVVRGHAVFYELVRRESRLPGEWEYLEGFRKADHLAPPESSDLLRSLQRRLLVLPEDDHLRLRVPLMARWLRARG